MIFINELLKKIWEPYTEEYKRLYEKYIKFNESELIQHITDFMRLDSVSKSDNYIQQDNVTGQSMNFTALFSCGCPYWKQKGTLTGCSFCDFFTSNFEAIVMNDVLKEKNISIYNKYIIDFIKKSRKNMLNANPLEHITGFDSLNTLEISSEIIEKLLDGNDQLFTNGFTVLSSETRATSITTKNIRRWKKNVKGKLLIHCGVEVDNEWLRNHWLNKGITNNDLFQAKLALQEEKCWFANDVVLGIPGLTDAQSIELFTRVCCFCLKNTSKYVLVSPLLRKGNNMQKVIAQYFAEDTDLNKIGICGDSNTAIHILSVFIAVYNTLTQYPEFIKRIQFATGHFNIYCSYIEEEYKNKKEVGIVKLIIQSLRDYLKSYNFEHIQIVYEKIKDSDFFIEHCEKLKCQHGIKQIKETMLLVATKISKLYWKNDWEYYLNMFKNELLDFEI